MKVAFICPLYDMKNHFDLAFNLYKSMIDLGVDEPIYYIFSDVPQKDKFAKRIKNAFGRELNYLILPKDQSHFKSKVVVKKMYALQQLMHEYDYLSIIDSESVFIRKTDFAQLFEDIWNDDGCLNANVSPDGFPIMRKCFRTLSKELYHNKVLMREFGNYNYNIWFNEIPVYKCANLPNFFKWLEKFDENGWKNEWMCFEYYLYAAYLLLHEGKHIIKHKDIVSNGGVMEYLFQRQIDEQRQIIAKLGTHWSSSCESAIGNTYILFHLDRVNGEGGYSFDLSEKYQRNMKLKRNAKLMIDFVLDRILCGWFGELK